MDAHHQQLRGLENSVYQFCVDYAARPQKGYRMIIYGENGSGKSHAAKAIAKWANMISMKLPLVNDLTSPGGKLARCEYHSWPQSVNRLKGGEWDLVDCMTDPELLVLDDVGAEHDPSKMGVEKLYLLLEQREKKWTVITTNTTPAAWAQRFERRIASRFFRNAKHVALDQVPDYGTK